MDASASALELGEIVVDEIDAEHEEAHQAQQQEHREYLARKVSELSKSERSKGRD